MRFLTIAACGFQEYGFMGGPAWVLAEPLPGGYEANTLHNVLTELPDIRDTLEEDTFEGRKWTICGNHR